MFENINNLKVCETIYGNTADFTRIENRPNHILITRVSGKVVFEFDDMTIKTEPGECILLPCGCSYCARRISEEASEFALLRFEGDGDFHKPKKFSIDDFPRYMTLSHRLGYSLLFDEEKKKLSSLSLFYEMLSLLSPETESAYVNSRKLELIKPALTYLEEHIYDQDLVIGTLSKLCNISDVYLRQIFFQYTGKSICKYITEKRLDRAKSMLDNEDYVLIREVAEAVGYSNPLYFSRLFKNRFGYSPRYNLRPTGSPSNLKR